MISDMEQLTKSCIGPRACKYRNARPTDNTTRINDVFTRKMMTKWKHFSGANSKESEAWKKQAVDPVGNNSFSITNATV